VYSYRTTMPEAKVQKHFEAALDRLIEQVKEDRSILAAILCGSLSYDRVWEKSDIDLVLVTIDDKDVAKDDAGVALFADGVNVHANLMTRTDFRKTIEGALRNSFMHSLLAKGRLLYTHDKTIADLCANLHDIGERDTTLQLLRAGIAALPAIYKAHKWFLTRKDLDYTALWILYAATCLAQIEVVGRKLLADREVILQALKLNPKFFKVVYSDLLNGKKPEKSVQAALDAVDAYMAERAPSLFEPIIEHLREVGETRSCKELENHFERNLGVGGITTACEYLSDLGIIGKASTTVKLTRRSNIAVQELAFVYLGDPPDEF
jgi:Polymerase beta, Nucleotidyltransferase